MYIPTNPNNLEELNIFINTIDLFKNELQKNLLEIKNENYKFFLDKFFIIDNDNIIPKLIKFKFNNKDIVSIPNSTLTNALFLVPNIIELTFKRSLWSLRVKLIITNYIISLDSIIFIDDNLKEIKIY